MSAAVSAIRIANEAGAPHSLHLHKCVALRERAHAMTRRFETKARAQFRLSTYIWNFCPADNNENANINSRLLSLLGNRLFASNLYLCLCVWLAPLAYLRPAICQHTIINQSIRCANQLQNLRDHLRLMPNPLDISLLERACTGISHSCGMHPNAKLRRRIVIRNCSGESDSAAVPRRQPTLIMRAPNSSPNIICIRTSIGAIDNTQYTRAQRLDGIFLKQKCAFSVGSYWISFLNLICDLLRLNRSIRSQRLPPSLADRFSFFGRIEILCTLYVYPVSMFEFFFSGSRYQSISVSRIPTNKRTNS